MTDDKLKINEEELKQRLTPEQYRVLREKGTEAPWSSPLLKANEQGVFTCAVCGNPLFASDAKFDSGTGWPSFDQALPGAVELRPDNSLGLERTEVVCARCGSHLGHVFNDNPDSPTGQRFCINGVCLLPKKE